MVLLENTGRRMEGRAEGIKAHTEGKAGLLRREEENRGIVKQATIRTQ